MNLQESTLLNGSVLHDLRRAETVYDLQDIVGVVRDFANRHGWCMETVEEAESSLNLQLDFVQMRSQVHMLLAMALASFPDEEEELVLVNEDAASDEPFKPRVFWPEEEKEDHVAA